MSAAPDSAEPNGDVESEDSAFERFETLAKALVKVPKDQVDALVKKRRKA